MDDATLFRNMLELQNVTDTPTPAKEQRRFSIHHMNIFCDMYMFNHAVYACHG